MKLSEIRREAREALMGKWKKGVAIVVVYLVIALGISFIMSSFDDEAAMGAILAVVEFIISIPLSFGLAWSFLKLKRNEEVKAFDFLKIGVNNFSRAWTITGRTLLKMILPILVLVIGVIVYAGMVVYSAMQLTVGATDAATTGMVVGIAIYIISIVYMISVLLLYSLTSFIAYDKPNMTALEVVNESRRLMKGNRWRIILLELSFIGWALLCLLTLGIGYLWLLPYMQVAMVCFYEKLALQD